MCKIYKSIHIVSLINMANDKALCRIVNKFRSHVNSVSSLDIKDHPLILKHLCIDDGKLKWFGKLEGLKSFLESLVGLSRNGHRQEVTLKVCIC